MAKQVINVGTNPNDGTGDLLRDAMIKVNDNFTELYTDTPVSNTITVGNSSVNTVVNSTSVTTKNVIVTNDLTVTGNVYLQGETTFSNAINITTTDKQLILANSATTNTLANNSGFVVGNSANLLYSTDVSGWQSNVNISPSTNNLTLGTTTRLWEINANTINVRNVNALAITANGSLGSQYQILTSNGTGVYWAAITSLNLDMYYQYNWQNAHTFANTVAFNGSTTTVNSAAVFTKSISANGTTGTNNYVLTSSGGTANAAWKLPQLQTTANNTDTNTYYFPMSNAASGTWSNAIISDSVLYFVPSTGTLNATIFNSLSDREKKENITKITDAIDIINQLNGVRFDWKSNHQPSAGLIAQDVEEVMPELVHTNPTTGDKSLNYSGVIAVLVEAVKYLLENK